MLCRSKKVKQGDRTLWTLLVRLAAPWLVKRARAVRISLERSLSRTALPISVADDASRFAIFTSPLLQLSLQNTVGK
jgi:hypothetical protein